MKNYHPKNFRINYLSFAAFVGCCLISGAAYAAGGAAHSDGPLPTFSEFLSQKRIYWINFIVYATLLGFLLKRIFAKAWEARRLAYQQAITSGQRLLADSEKKLADAQKLIASVPEETKSLRRRLEKEFEFESQKIIQEASDKAAKIKNQASQSMAVERRAAISKYEEALVNLAVARARTKVSGSLSDEIDSRLRERVVGSVAGLLH